MSGLEWLAVGVALGLVIGGGAWFWLWRTHGQPPEPPGNGPPPPGRT
jgi:hypothetical protein